MCFRRHRLLTLALLWLLVAMLPTHSFIARLDPIGEGQMYLAAFGPAIALVTCAAQWFRDARVHRSSTVFASIVLIVALCNWRTSSWADPGHLWQEATLRSPESARAWTNPGMAYLTQGNSRAAREAFRHYLKLDPANTLAFFNLETLAATTPLPLQ